jgi:hypothetical protein
MRNKQNKYKEHKGFPVALRQNPSNTIGNKLHFVYKTPTPKMYKGNYKNPKRQHTNTKLENLKHINTNQQLLTLRLPQADQLLVRSNVVQRVDFLCVRFLFLQVACVLFDVLGFPCCVFWI